MRADGMKIENEYFTLRVDPKSGCITSLIIKKDNYESLAPGSCGNLVQAFQDKPKDYDAWNIDADFEKVHWDLTAAESVKLIDQTPSSAVIRVIKKFQSSTIEQDITVHDGIPRVDIDTDVDWREKHILLKAGFAVAAKSNSATVRNSVPVRFSGQRRATPLKRKQCSRFPHCDGPISATHHTG